MGIVSLLAGAGLCRSYRSGRSKDASVEIFGRLDDRALQRSPEIAVQVLLGVATMMTEVGPIIQRPNNLIIFNH
jgi:hypothetical protein